MTIRFLEAAQEEFECAVKYYNQQQPGLGQAFAIEVYRTLERVRANPEAWGRLSARTRRCLTRRFPYGVLYQIRDDHLLVVAVMHLRRQPDQWRKRAKE